MDQLRARIAKAHAAPRCSATSKRTGVGCKAPAERGKRVCRFHGARGGAPKGEAHGMYRHGRFTCEAMGAKRSLRLLLALSKATILDL
ncbi:hypothetical protein EJ074_20530 [Mesorhizobium sp. M3A.F.Ca.ET.080.04.2.1]|nr:hypothetical protein EJ074_20530 [Mesorhizobium sp. M3A.F.Ca.ET.080.04.2.1]RWF23802.1 MAG: hypothetical protein EOS64_10040 [Mesorhizobium sp.]